MRTVAFKFFLFFRRRYPCRLQCQRLADSGLELHAFFNPYVAIGGVADANGQRPCGFSLFVTFTDKRKINRGISAVRFFLCFLCLPASGFSSKRPRGSLILQKPVKPT